LFTIPPALKLLWKIFVRVAGWYDKIEEIFKHRPGKDNPIEAWLLQTTRRLERLLRGSIESRLLEATRRYERLFRGKRQS
jgi:hypothetical protein